MCGITGIVGAEDLGPLQTMTEALRHRGPDAGDTAVVDGCGLGHRRLSIIDIDGGAQPMTSADGRYTLSYNGEIYNFAELRRELAALGYAFRSRSDTEVILAAYVHWGDDMLERLNGMFALAVWDGRDKRLLLARDRVGIKPLYYADLGTTGALAFGSEPKALLALPEVSTELDINALDAYLDLLYVPPPLSMFAGIRQLPPGCTLVWSAGRKEIKRYWDAAPAIDRRYSLEQWCEIVEPVLEDAIVRRMVSDVPVGAFLSGGLDSSTIVAILSERGHTGLDTFCVGYGTEGRTFDERSAAREVAKYFGTRHHELQLDGTLLHNVEAMVRGFDEPFGSITALLSWALSRFARERVTVAVAGDGGDELFGGYPRYRGMGLSHWAERVPAPLLAATEAVARGRESSGARSYRRWARQFIGGARRPAAQRYASWVGYARCEERDELLAPEALERLDRGARPDPVAEHFARPHDAVLVERAAYADLHGFLPHNVLRNSDRMSMAHGLELRVPFCDHRLFELMAQIPSRHRVDMLATKKVLRRIMRRRVPKFVLSRKKLGFVPPIGAWMQRDLDDMLTDWFDPATIQKRRLLRPATIERLAAEHRAGRRDHGLRLWSLLVLEQWCRSYL